MSQTSTAPPLDPLGLAMMLPAEAWSRFMADAANALSVTGAIGADAAVLLGKLAKSHLATAMSAMAEGDNVDRWGG